MVTGYRPSPVNSCDLGAYVLDKTGILFHVVLLFKPLLLCLAASERGNWDHCGAFSWYVKLPWGADKSTDVTVYWLGFFKRASGEYVTVYWLGFCKKASGEYTDMRIRKRSGALFTSSSSWERASSSTSCLDISTDNGNGEEADFLVPLVSAVMDVQRAEDKEGEGDHGTRTLGTHQRPAHNWRNALQFQCIGDRNTESQALENGGESKKVDCRWNGSMRNQWDNIRLSTKEGTQGTLLMKEYTSSIVEKEITGGRDEESKLQKPGLFDMGTSWRQQKNLHSVKLKIRNDEIGYIKRWKDDETKTTKKLRQEDGGKVDDKVRPISNHEAEGFQCRRRNGRGWRCSQRILVGYSLCEHHLANDRLKSKSSNNYNNANTVTLNNKAGTCKLKELRLIDAS